MSRFELKRTLFLSSKGAIASETGNAPPCTLCNNPSAAGLLDDSSPEARVIAEAEEETGFQITQVEKVFEAYMSPGSVTEKLFFFIAEYSDHELRGDGGGLIDEGEDIEVLEWPFEKAMHAIKTNEIIDAKTIMLLQHLALNAIID